MPDRWEEASSRLRQLRPARDLWDRIEDGPQLPPLPPPRRTRVTTIVAALGIFAIATAVLWATIEPIGRHMDHPSSPDVVRVPPRGAASAIFLEDGRPAFIVHHEDGSVSVVDAFSSDRPWGILQLNGWCASSREFVDLAHGARFDEYGAYELGPAPSGLATFAFTPVTLDDRGDPASITIGGLLAPAPKAADVPVPSRADGCRATDRDRMLTHTFARDLGHRSPPDDHRGDRERLGCGPGHVACRDDRDGAALQGHLRNPVRRWNGRPRRRRDRTRAECDG